MMRDLPDYDLLVEFAEAERDDLDTAEYVAEIEKRFGSEFLECTAQWFVATHSSADDIVHAFTHEYDLIVKIGREGRSAW